MELFDPVWALLSNIIFVAIVLFFIWYLIKITEYDKKINKLICSKIEWKILIGKIRQVWDKVVEKPLYGVDLLLSLFFKASLAIWMLGFLLFFFKGPWTFRVPLGISIYLLGFIGIGVAQILRGVLKYGGGFLKDAYITIAIWIFVIIWNISTLNFINSPPPSQPELAPHLFLSAIWVIDFLLGSIVFIPFMIFALGDIEKMRDSETVKVSCKKGTIGENIVGLSMLLVLIGFIIPTLSYRGLISLYGGLFLILGGSLARIAYGTLRAYLRGRLKKALLDSMVLLIGILIVAGVLAGAWGLTTESISTASEVIILIVTGIGLAMILVGLIFALPMGEETEKLEEANMQERLRKLEEERHLKFLRRLRAERKKEK